jgi:hypothetical protein
MKEPLRVGLALVTTVSLAACGGSSDDSPNNQPVDSGTVQESGTGGDSGNAEFEPYFDGASLDGFEYVGVTANDMTIENGVLRCNCLPNGYFYKNEIFRNFVLELEYRFERPTDLAPGTDSTFTGNSGVFVYLAPPHGIWPTCLEVQGSYQETGDIFRLPGLLPGNDTFDTTALASAKKLVGEWNTLVVTSNEGALTVVLNGITVNQSTPGDLVEGIVALESEGAKTEWRNVRIQRLP